MDPVGAADFRRSIEASLPPLTQYGHMSGQSAPGVYGVWGWGMYQGIGRGDDSVRASHQSLAASALGASQDFGVAGSASLRNSFAYNPAPEQQLTESFQQSVSLGTNSLSQYVASAPAPAAVAAPAPAPAPPAGRRRWATTPQDGQYQQDQQSKVPEPGLGKPPTAPLVMPPPPAIAGDATVVVTSTGPNSRYYPSLPGGQGSDTAPNADPGNSVHGYRGPDQYVPGPQAAYGNQPQGNTGAPAAETTVRFKETITYHHYQQQSQPQQQPQPHLQQYQHHQQQQPAQPSHSVLHPPVPPPHFQQPYQPQPNPSGYAPSGLAQPNLGKVVHMRRTEAWTKYIAYEGCLQVCMNELERGNDDNARYFLSGTFAVLRQDLGIDGLLLTQVTGMPSTALGTDGGINDICWDDLEPPEKRLNTVAFAHTTVASYMRIRCQQLNLPTTSVLQKLCCRRRTHICLPTFSGVKVQLGSEGDACAPTEFGLDAQGMAVHHGQAVVFPLDNNGPQRQDAVPAPQQMHILVHNSDGKVAMGVVPYRELWRRAMMQREPLDEADAERGLGTTIEVQVHGQDAHAGKQATVVLLVTRVRAEAQGYELAHVAPEGGGMGGGGGVETVNKNTLRTNACLAYDTALAAALAASGCCRTKLLVTGPWEWLLAQFAATFGVRHFYCLLAHLRWVLKPGVATVSSLCLDVIGSEVKPLLDQSAARGLTTHEATLLEGVKKAVEMLLEVAFENYYALADDQPRAANSPGGPGGGGGSPRAQGPDLGWRPTVLMACFRLFRTMKDVFLPTDQDWLNTRFRIAAKKRWHFLECNCGFDQLRDLNIPPPPGPGPARGPSGRPGGAPATPIKLGVNTTPHDPYYKMAEKMGMAIKGDLEFDIFLQKQPDLLPSSLNLPRITAEEYMANLVEILRNMLGGRCPPQVPSEAAVDLLVATAQLQRYLQDTQLYMPRQHPGHLDAMELWRPHVLLWIDNSRRGLCAHCTRLEADAKLSAAHLARVDVAKMPGMIEGIEGAVAPLVHDMLDRTWAELRLYERVVRNWPLFGPHLEAALCDVLRTVQGSLNRICQGANGNTVMQQGPPGVIGAGAMHRRGPSGQYAPGPGMGGSPGPMAQGRTASPYGAHGMGQHGHGHSPMGGAGAMAGGVPGGRNAVLLKEAVLLNSLKVLMVMVPSIEDVLSKWCGGSSIAPPGPPHPHQQDPEYDDDLAPHIGAQFAQVVKELRTDYAEGVAACANRMANHIRATPNTNIKAALQQPRPQQDAAFHGQVSNLTQQREYVESFMRPVLAACEEALQALRSALDPRVFVATGRALWDCMGKDLFEFVHFLQEGHDNKGAWRLRQHANLALSQLCEFFRGRLAASMEHCIGERDLDLPNHVDKAQKLLAQNTAVVNITLNPI